MKNTPIDSKIELTRGVHLLRFSKSFLYIPGAAWSSTRLQPVKQAHEVRAPLFIASRPALSIAKERAHD